MHSLQLGLSDKQLYELMSSIDVDRDSTISFDEFAVRVRRFMLMRCTRSPTTRTHKAPFVWRVRCTFHTPCLRLGLWRPLCVLDALPVPCWGCV